MAEKKKNTSKKTTKKKSPPKKNTDNFVALILVAISILFVIFIYLPDGFFGSFIHEFFTGLFGWCAYLLPVLCFVWSGHAVALKKNYAAVKSKYAAVGGIIGTLSVLTHLFSVEEASILSVDAIAMRYESGLDYIGGGVIGGTLADILRALVGQLPAVIIGITILLIFSMLIVDWSPVKCVLRVLVKAYMQANHLKIKTEEYIQEHAQNDEYKEYEEPLPNETAKKNNRFRNFADEDIGIDKKPKKTLGKKKNTEDITLKTDVTEPLLDDIPEAFPEIDSIIDEAIPQSDIPPAELETTFTDDTPSKPLEDEPALAEDVTENNAKIIDAPQKVTGMEDVSDEIEEEFERIPYTFPDVSLLGVEPQNGSDSDFRAELRDTAQKLTSILKSFNVDAHLVNVSKGPTVTRFELALGDGIKVSKIANLSNDIALRLAAQNVRIEPVPGKDAIGIEIPNKTVSTVRLREVIDSDEFREFSSPLAFAMGKDISGKNIIFDLSKMPHVLIAGSTGSGKSVCINTLITSIIYKSDPNDVKLVMIDPKVVELGIYNGIPHLLIPVVTEPRRASGALYWAVQEMLRRYALFADNNVRDIKGYNRMLQRNGNENTLPHIVIIIDELADLMMVAPKEVEDSICRLAQMARAAGMHLVIATQRPSVDVITGLIKANIPSRIAFAVSSHIDSRTILDASGADKLLGRGDMLFKPVGAPKPLRIQGAFVDDQEVERIVNFVKGDREVKYNEDIIEKIDAGKPVNITDEQADPTDNDELLPKAIEIAVDAGKISASHLQRRLKVGFSRASRIIDQMEERGIVSHPDGSKPREVLLSKEDFLEMEMRISE